MNYSLVVFGALSYLVIMGMSSALMSYIFVIKNRGLKNSVSGRSHCVCGRSLTSAETIPIFSWIWLRGKAKCCGAKLPIIYLVGETLAAIFGALILVNKFSIVGLLATYVVMLVLPHKFFVENASINSTINTTETELKSPTSMPPSDGAVI